MKINPVSSSLNCGFSSAFRDNQAMHVYFITTSFQSHSWLKIGKAKNPKSRLTELQVGCPFKASISDVIECVSDAHALQMENFAHQLFKIHRTNGEWFEQPTNWRSLVNSVRAKANETLPPKTTTERPAGRLVTLEAWAEAQWSPPPAAKTLQRWARLGWINPPPLKHGRCYYVEQKAQFDSSGRTA